MRTTRLAGFRILAMAMLTLAGLGAAAVPAQARENASALDSSSRPASTVTVNRLGCTATPPRSGFVRIRAFVGTDSCGQCIAEGWDGVHGGAWRGFTCWTTVAGPGEWRTHELWVRGY
ncbi:hypothetical protein [Nonomuraea typhae]|uniref:hypothetical protein n=1 Tax=Nonomuraea typhae TaxID=2603600 RepID=UPI0012FADCAE|nr:hypothetical protein [Nonomuraea typhae]